MNFCIKFFVFYFSILRSLSKIRRDNWLFFSRRRRFAIRICLLALGLSAWLSDARADVVLDPLSGSYFEYVEQHSTWATANLKANAHFYNDRHGRLAVIKTRETHEFLIKNLKNGRRIAWIGLRYFCSNKKLTWVTGEAVEPGAGFQPWSEQWARTRVRCGPEGYMPVYYANKRWQAAGPGKGGAGFIVEYPKP